MRATILDRILGPVIEAGGEHGLNLQASQYLMPLLERGLGCMFRRQTLRELGRTAAASRKWRGKRKVEWLDE